MMKRYLLLGLILVISTRAHGQRLFVGLEGSSTPPTCSSDLSGFPDVSWENHFVFDISGAAATPAGLIYLCNGSFTTELYAATLANYPEHLCTTGVDLHALAFGRGTLWGYSNYASPKGIYAIDPSTGDATLVLDVYTGTSYRFFALDYNPVDDLLYGYTEYGNAGLYAINIDTGEMTRLAGTIPAANGQGRGLAVGNHTVYLTATRGDDDIPHFAYDLSQGPGGTWVGFTNPYPDYHSAGGAAWIPEPFSGIQGDALSAPTGLRWEAVGPNPAAGPVGLNFYLPTPGAAHLAMHDAAGRRVATVFAGVLQSGPHAVHWNGCDSAGRPISAGVYYARLSFGKAVKTCRIVLVR